MQMIPVRIHAVGDPEPIFPDLSPVGGEAEIVGFGILQNGTEQGKTSCAIMVMVEGKAYLCQCTGNMFLTLAAAVKGAKARFGDPWDGV